MRRASRYLVLAALWLSVFSAGPATAQVLTPVPVPVEVPTAPPTPTVTLPTPQAEPVAKPSGGDQQHDDGFCSHLGIFAGGCKVAKDVGAVIQDPTVVPGADRKST